MTDAEKMGKPEHAEESAVQVDAVTEDKAPALENPATDAEVLANELNAVKRVLMGEDAALKKDDATGEASSLGMDAFPSQTKSKPRSRAKAKATLIDPPNAELSHNEPTPSDVAAVAEETPPAESGSSQISAAPSAPADEIEDLARSVKLSLGEAGFEFVESDESWSRPPIFGETESSAPEMQVAEPIALESLPETTSLPEATSVPETASASVPEVSPEAYFAGWDGLNLPEEQEPQPDPDLLRTFNKPEPEFEPEPQREPEFHRAFDEPVPEPDFRRGFTEPKPAERSVFADVSYFEPSLRSLAEARAAEPDLSVKHDALAMAVQSALNSVYGDETPPASGDDAAHDESVSVFSSAAQRRGFEQSPSEDHESSPQDVILNYFSYKPKAADNAIHVDAATSRQASQNDYHERQPESVGAYSGGGASADVFRMETPFRTAQTFTNPANSYAYSQQDRAADNRYDSLTPYKEPVTALVPTQQDGYSPSPESSRLLGAAGIGLIGGIAIAATLAVFVINNNNPNASVSVAPEVASTKTNDRIGTESGGAAQGSLANVQPSGKSSSVPAPVKQARPIEVLAADVSSSTRQGISLAIALRADRPSDQTLISIIGVPEGGRLNVGVDAGGGNWLLPPKRLNDVALSVPQDARDVIPLEVQAIDIIARTPISERKKFLVRIVAPAPVIASVQGGGGLADTRKLGQDTSGSAPRTNPTTAAFSTQTVPTPGSRTGSAVGFETQTVQTTAQPQPAPVVSAPVVSPSSTLTPANDRVASLPSNGTDASVSKPSVRPEIEDFIREGNKRMREGDIVKAREFYQRAYALGDAEAALAMGRSFDPIYFERIQKKNADADPAKALEWYKLAMDGGAAQTAKIRIDNLKQYLNR